MINNYYNFGDTFAFREEFWIEYPTNQGATKEDFNLEMNYFVLSHIKIDYIAPYFQIRDILNTSKYLIIEKKQTIDHFMEKYFLPDYTKIHLS